MSFSRRTFTQAAAVALASPFILRPASAQAVVTLKLHHFLPPIANGQAKLLSPWAKDIEQESQGKIKIDIYPSMQLGGTPPQLYDQARDGVADIIWTLPGSTPGRFPSTEVFELPFIASRHARVNALAAQEFADKHLKDEVKDVKMLAYWTHDGGLIHANKAIHRHAGAASARKPCPEGYRWCGGALGSGAVHQGAGTGEISHRYSRLTHALCRELLPGHEQGQI
jgi:TRAP-type transport system periplasmic protein